MSNDIQKEGLFTDLGRAAAKTLSTYRKTRPKSSGRVSGSPATSAGSFGRSVQEKLAQSKFIKNFVSRGIQSLDNAVKMGLVDPTSNTLGPATQPAQSGATTAPTPPGQKQASVKPQIDQNVDKIVSAMRQLQPAGTKPLPPQSNISKEITTDLGKVSLNKDYLLRVGERILKANNAGYDVKNFHKQFMGQLAKGTKQKTISEDILQDNYQKLNFLFETYLNLLEQQNQVVSISQWFKTNFLDPYLKGIDMSSAQPRIDQILKDLPNSYKTGKIKKDLTDIAKMAWTLGYTARRN